MNEWQIYFFKEGIKGLAFKGIPHITDFSEASVPLIIGLSIKTQSESRMGEGCTRVEDGVRAAGVADGTALERHNAGFPLVMCPFLSSSRNGPTMDGISCPNQKALASPLSEVHSGPAIVPVNQELNVHW